MMIADFTVDGEEFALPSDTYTVEQILEVTGRLRRGQDALYIADKSIGGFREVYGKVWLKDGMVFSARRKTEWLGEDWQIKGNDPPFPPLAIPDDEILKRLRKICEQHIGWGSNHEIHGFREICETLDVKVKNE